ncbi:MAG TPA: hypothetical protein VNS09_15070 [Solirubrobacter sp.]|nr:hypothetical protein [Solirubrobacter sp.]
MRFRPRDLEGIAAGRVTLAFRRWERPRMKAGSRQVTSIGVIEVTSVARVDVPDEADARAAGYASGEAVLRAFAGRPGDLYRVALRVAGPDPRVALRAVPPDDALFERLDRMGRWTYEVLAAIAAHPGLRAPDLAASFGRETLPFKRDVRKLKALGLTESLPVGYRLSPRGAAVLERRARTGE